VASGAKGRGFDSLTACHNKNKRLALKMLTLFLCLAPLGAKAGAKLFPSP